jgi:hypothetical protein
MVLTSYYERVHKTGKAILFTDSPLPPNTNRNQSLSDADYIATQWHKTTRCSNCVEKTGMEWQHFICNDWHIGFHTCTWPNNLGLCSILWQDDYRVNGEEVSPLQPYYLGICSRTKKISQKPSPRTAGPKVAIWNWSLQHMKHACSTLNHGPNL